MPTTKVRKVKIVVHPNCIWVLYVDRKKYGHHSPAQFDPRIRTVAQVEEWVRNNPKLELVRNEQELPCPPPNEP